MEVKSRCIDCSDDNCPISIKLNESGNESQTEISEILMNLNFINIESLLFKWNCEKKLMENILKKIKKTKKWENGRDYLSVKSNSHPKFAKKAKQMMQKQNSRNQKIMTEKNDFITLINENIKDKMIETLKKWNLMNGLYEKYIITEIFGKNQKLKINIVVEEIFKRAYQNFPIWKAIRENIKRNYQENEKRVSDDYIKGYICDIYLSISKKKTKNLENNNNQEMINPPQKTSSQKSEEEIIRENKRAKHYHLHKDTLITREDCEEIIRCFIGIFFYLPFFFF